MLRSPTPRRPVTIALLASASLILLAPIALLISSSLVISPYSSNITTIDKAKHTDIGIVLGAGITKSGKPFKELEARLDIAAAAIEAGKVDELILSGDNRFENYDEPTAMIDYLVNTKHIDRDKLHPDYAGRSTYESCERARKVFGLNEAVVFSAGSHLPRAMYLCDHFGVRTVGISSGVEAANAGRREPLARVKALYNVHIKGEPTILGTPISVQD